MPDIGLPTGASRAPKGPRGGRGFKRGAGRGCSGQFVAHDITGVKERTEDVVTGDSREKTFPDLLLSQPVLNGLHTAGFVQPSPVQLLAIPPAKVGFDLIVQAKSGTGKTCVYVVAALEMLKPDLQGLQALVLAPTREIAIQGVTVAMQVGQEMGQVKMAAFIGGISLAEDKMKAKTCQLGVGTPGRLKQLITEGILPVDSVRLVVLDEADKLLEPAFLADTTAILNMLPKSKQVLALSATYPDQLASLAERFMRSPQHIRPGQVSQVLTGVAQFLYKVQHCPAPARQTNIKHTALLSILSSVPYTQVLVFSNYSTIAQATTDFLNSRGFPAIFISAGQDQSRRLAAMQSFKQFNCRILCSTDLTARGIDAENVNLVINLEVPWEQNTYLHRIGRGGRFGSLSLAVTLASEGEEVRKMRGVVKKTGSVVRILPVELPRDVRGEMEDMNLLEAEVEEDGDQVDEQPEEESNNYTEVGKQLEQKDKNSGKIKRRGKRKANDETIGITTLEKDENLDNKFKMDQKEAEKDRNVVNKFLTKEMGEKSKSDVPSFKDITETANKLEKGEEVNSKEDVENVMDKNHMEGVGQVVQRISSRRREEYGVRLEEMKKRMEGKEVSFLLEKLSVGDVMEEPKQNTIDQTGITGSAENKNKKTESPDTSHSESSSDESSSSSSSISGSDSESESDSSTSSSDSDKSRHPAPAADINIHYPAPPGYPPYASYPSYPPSYQPLPTHPPPPGHPSAHAWYTQWAATVAQQRMAVQQAEYNKHMQYLAYKQARK